MATLARWAGKTGVPV